MSSRIFTSRTKMVIWKNYRPTSEQILRLGDISVAISAKLGDCAAHPLWARLSVRRGGRSRKECSGAEHATISATVRISSAVPKKPRDYLRRCAPSRRCFVAPRPNAVAAAAQRGRKRVAGLPQFSRNFVAQAFAISSYVWPHDRPSLVAGSSLFGRIVVAVQSQLVCCVVAARPQFRCQAVAIRSQCGHSLLAG